VMGQPEKVGARQIEKGGEKTTGDTASMVFPQKQFYSGLGKVFS
jgi:hypothetical protein